MARFARRIERRMRQARALARVGIPLPRSWRMRVGDEDMTVEVEVDASDADLQSFGFDADQIVSPQDRAAAVKAYNDARIAMAEAKAGKTLNAISSGVGVAVLALTFTFPPGAALLAGVWAGAYAAFKGLQAIFGTAHAGPGAWTDFCANAPPIDENDPNWWHAVDGYASALARTGRGADTPWTRGRLGPWPSEPAAHGFGDIGGRIAHVDPRAQPFAHFAMPLLYRSYELAMNCRNWSKIGGVDYANLPSDFGHTEGGVYIANPFEIALHMWNSQHDGPSVGIQNAYGVFPIIPDGEWFVLNIGPMKAGRPLAMWNQGALAVFEYDDRARAALVAVARWLALYGARR